MTVPRIAAVIEVSADTTGEAPGGLIRAAYRASREGTVALLLNGVSAAQVDRALDAVVPLLSGVSGVVYCTPATLERVLQESGWPRIAFVGTRALAAPLAQRGVRVLPAEEALRALGEWDAESVPEAASTWT
jgi:hypothetical protein